MPHIKPRTVTVRPDHFEKLRENTHVLYRCYTRKDMLLYVGMTNNPEYRFSQHKADKVWWKHVYYLTIEQYPDREVLAAAEAVAIRSEKPNTGYKHTKRGQPLWPEASNFCTRILDHSDLINMTLEQQLYPCVECHARAIYNDGDTVACGLCSNEWTYDVWFDMTFNAKADTPHQLRLL